MTEQEKIDYTARFGDQSNVVRICFNLKDRVGVGTEYLIINGAIAAKYKNGNQDGPLRAFPSTPQPAPPAVVKSTT